MRTNICTLLSGFRDGLPEVRPRVRRVGRDHVAQCVFSRFPPCCTFISHSTAANECSTLHTMLMRKFKALLQKCTLHPSTKQATVGKFRTKPKGNSGKFGEIRGNSDLEDFSQAWFYCRKRPPGQGNSVQPTRLFIILIGCGEERPHGQVEP